MKSVFFIVWTGLMLSTGAYGGWYARAIAQPVIQAYEQAGMLTRGGWFNGAE